MAEPTNKACVFVAILLTALQFLHVAQGLTVTANGTLILEDNSEISLEFDPPQITDLETKHEQHVYFNVTLLSFGKRADVVSKDNFASSALDMHTVPDNVWIRVQCDHQKNAIIPDPRDFRLVDVISRNTDLDPELNSTNPENGPLYFTVRGLFLGYSRVNFYINDTVAKNNSFASHDSGFVEEGTLLPIEYTVAVIREKRIVDNVFIAAVAFLVFFSNMGMGCKVDLDVVKEILKKPIAPSIGFCCQYIIMPLVSIVMLLMMM